jgi:hypothetical protein
MQNSSLLPRIDPAGITGAILSYFYDFSVLATTF